MVGKIGRQTNDRKKNVADTFRAVQHTVRKLLPLPEQLLRGGLLTSKILLSFLKTNRKEVTRQTKEKPPKQNHERCSFEQNL